MEGNNEGTNCIVSLSFLILINSRKDVLFDISKKIFSLCVKFVLADIFLLLSSLIVKNTK